MTHELQAGSFVALVAPIVWLCRDLLPAIIVPHRGHGGFRPYPARRVSLRYHSQKPRE
jgi:hypothetical protein